MERRHHYGCARSRINDSCYFQTRFEKEVRVNSYCSLATVLKKICGAIF